MVVTIFTVVVLSFVARGVFLVWRYSLPGKSCEQHVTHPFANDTAEIVEYVLVLHPQKLEGIFTACMYGICSLLRILEYFLLGQGVCRYVCYLKTNPWRDDMKKKVKKWAVIYGLAMLPLFLFTVGIIVFGVLVELEYGRNLRHCDKHSTFIFIVYCGLNLFRYLCAVSARLLLMLATVAVGKFWFPDGAQSTEANPFQWQVQPESQDIERLIEDWNAVANKHEELTKKYSKRGHEVQKITEIFQTWFVIPWITFFVASSIKVTDVISPWLIVEHSEKGTTASDLPAIYYMMYNLFQVISLFLASIFGQMMNSYHEKFYQQMREEQLRRAENKSRRSLSRMMMIEKNDKYDFVSRVWGTSIKIHLKSPFYVLILLVGIFFTVSTALLKS